MTRDVDQKKPRKADKADNATLQRLNQFVAQQGQLSRRKADEAIMDGRVTVNGRPAEVGQKVHPHLDKIFLDKQPLTLQKQQYVVFHKPKGVLTTASDPKDRQTIYDVLPNQYKHLKPAGRLDRNTSGLLILSNDGDFLNHLMHPSFGHKKLYRVTVDKKLTRTVLEQLEAGVWFEAEQVHAKAVVAEIHDVHKIDLSLTTGYNRQVRRMFEALGYTVVTLKRLAIGHVQLGNLSPGQCRPLSLRDRQAFLRKQRQ
ncbi:MAG: rRNA pseudouridine synthase [Cyanobacteria bacterium HKST-UBA06]|nr:rRNA pseudouridine synthase [Cyanobacteria bacterium HKST-UBA04]MCA9807002.1 rRNA pseudouridine synthase [Cyanobacteria bacterium HKST-UBA06]